MSSPSVRRWIDLILLSLAAAVVVIVFIFSFTAWVERILAVSLWVFFFVLLLIVILFIQVISKRGWVGVLGLKHFFKHPPFWFAAVLGFAWLLAIWPWLPSDVLLWGDVQTPIVLFVTALFFFLLLLQSLGDAKRNLSADSVLEKSIGDAPEVTHMTNDGDGIVQPFSSFSDLLDWVKTDDPITTKGADRLHHVAVSERMTRRLMKHPQAAQALIGRLGSGKTSVCHLVAERLKELNPSGCVHIVPISLWPYENARAATVGVIQALIEALGRETDVLALRTLPDAYVKAVASVGGFWSAIATLLRKDKEDPFEKLKKINFVAAAIGHRYILWVEDIERFAGQGRSDIDTQTLDELERLRPIRSLLYGLDELSHVTVITAATTLDARFDLEKIARFVERLPHLSTQTRGSQNIGAILDMFWSHCMDDANLINPKKELEPNTQGHLLGSLASVHLLKYQALFGWEHMDIERAILLLAHSPRAVKCALRGCWEAWEQLRGEVAFEDIYVMSFLRAYNPDIFSSVERLHKKLQYREEYPRSANHDAAVHGLGEIMKVDLERYERDSEMRLALLEVIKFVFSQPHKLQGLANDLYWNRYMTMQFSDERAKDQEALRLLKEGNDASLVQGLQDPKMAESLEAFQDLLSKKRLLEIFLPSVHAWMKEDPSSWLHNRVIRGRKEPNGFMSMWRIWAEKHPNESEAVDVLMQGLDATIPVHLELATLIERYFVTLVTKNNAFVLEPQELESLGKYLRARLVAACKSDASVLIDGLRPSTDPWVLDRLMWQRDETLTRPKDALPTLFEDWDAFKRVILEAVKLDPHVMLPQLAAVLIDGSEALDGSWYKYEYKKDRAAYFGGETEIAVLFKDQDPIQWSHERDQAMIRAIQNA